MHSAIRRFLDHRFGPFASAAAWLLATGVFLGMFSAFGGFYGGDSNLVDVPAYALAEGVAQCAYPPDLNTDAPLVYPVIAAGFVAVAGEPASQPFPRPTAGCRQMGTSIYDWQYRSTHQRILWAGMFGWAALLAGFVAVLRAAGRGRNGWEAISVVLLALVPQVAVTLTGFFHPEDLLALGLVLGGLAAIRRERWLVAGALFGVAIMTKQYALLVAVPVAIAVPPRRRAAFVGAMAAAVAVFALPMVLLWGADGVKAFIGSGGTLIRRGTIVDLAKLPSFPRLVVARVLPILVAGLVAYAARRRLGDRLLEPGPLLSLVAVSLALRLVFEVNFYDYYLMALAVTLLALDCCTGRIRGITVVWVLGGFYLVPIPVVLYSPIVNRYPVAVQAFVSLSGLAIAATSLWRSCQATPLPAVQATPSTS